MGESKHEYDYLYKIVLVGDSGVGKTNILSRFSRDTFSIDNISTIGVEFATRNIMDQNKIIKAQIWDTAGQERYRAISKAYYRGCSGVMIVFDVTRQETFSHVSRWMNEINENSTQSSIFLLVGNKTDISHIREVPTLDAETFATDNNMFFIETSALNGSNIDIAFQKIITEIHQKSKLDHSMLNIKHQKLDISKNIEIKPLSSHPTTNNCC